MENERVQKPQFEAMCEQLDEFEPLPSVVPADFEPDEEPEPLDDLILAGLVSP